MGVTTQSNEVTSNERETTYSVTGKKFEGSKIFKSFKNM